MKKFIVLLVVLAVGLTAASWQKKGETEDYEVTVISVIEVKQNDAYQLQSALKKKQSTLNKIAEVGLVQADGADLEQIANALKQGVSIEDQKSSLDAQIADMPEISKPVVEEDLDLHGNPKHGM